MWLSALLAVASAVEPVPIPVAATTLEAGSFIGEDDVDVVLVDGEQAAEAGLQDLAIDPLGSLVVQRILEGEPLRTERLFHPDYSGPLPVITGMRVLRVPLDPSRTVKGFDYADVWTTEGCTLLQATFVMGVEDERGVVHQGPDLVMPQRAALLLLTEDLVDQLETARRSGRLARIEPREEGDVRFREEIHCSR